MDVDDLGKRKGDNEARQNIIKKLRSTPTNPNVAMGGGANASASQSKPDRYKLYRVPVGKVAEPPRVSSKAKELKETMSKPVAVPLGQYVGLTMLATKDRTQLANKLANDASK